MKRTLILNVTYQPLTIVNGKRGLLLSYKDNDMKVLRYYDDVILSEKDSHQIPAVMLYPNYVNVAKKKQPSKRTVLNRDGYQCQYCGVNLNKNTATIDHIIPVSKFKNKKEANTWDNMTACCKKCNAWKGDRLPNEAGLVLRSKPKPPTSFLNIYNSPKEWGDYL